MTPYFEISLKPSIDYFLWVLPVLFLLVAFVRLPAITDLVLSTVKTSRNWLLSIFGVIFFIALFSTYSELQQDLDVKSQIDAGEFSLVSGCIQNYRLDEVKGHTATFEVQEVEFSYNNYTRTPFFYEKELPGKVIKNGNCLEISYLTISKENKIIKIVQLTK